jgi:sigma-B regulation protein RsbU (phosphoserine phosphatase)
LETHNVELTIYQPECAPERMLLSTPLATIGRASECTIPIRDRFLSRRHAEIVRNGEGWLLRDCGSANGTYLNGVRVVQEELLHKGDRILVGDAEIVFGEERRDPTTTISVQDSILATNLSMRIDEVVEQDSRDGGGTSRLQVLNALAMELLEDRPMSELFDFILERVMKLLHPSRAALALLRDDRQSFDNVKIVRSDANDVSELAISRTLLGEVAGNKKVVSFMDVKENDKLAQAKSIVAQSIRSALCAPLIVADSVIGVLYADFMITQPRIEEEDLKLVAQIARLAAVKVETTRLREEAVVKQRMEEELKTTYVIQSRLLPSAPPVIGGYSIAGVNRPCRTVSGDYFDYLVRPDGRLYFIVADVAGKGITAALMMASLATAFNIFASSDPSPAALLRQLNAALQPKLAPNKFITLFMGILDPASGKVDFANAGHCPPLWIRAGGVEELKTTDVVLGLFPNAVYRDQSTVLAPGDSLVLFTDGIVEAESEAGEELGSAATSMIIRDLHTTIAGEIVKHLEASVLTHCGTRPLGDDVTIMAMTRHQ